MHVVINSLIDFLRGSWRDDDHATRDGSRTQTGMKHSAADYHRSGSAMKTDDRWSEILLTNVACGDEKTVHDTGSDPHPEHHEHRQKKSVEDLHGEEKRAKHDAETSSEQ
jgi:hypothetical protein